MNRLFPLFLLVLLLGSCKNKSTKNTDSKPVYSNEKLDTVLSPYIPVGTKPAIFEKAFIKGSQEMSNGLMFDLFGFNMGKIKITTGKIISCDPWLMEEYAKPYTDSFPVGSFPVQLSLAKLKEVEVVAFARILFNDHPVVRWSYALLPGQENIPIGGKKIIGYHVDAQLGLFMDQGAYQALQKDTVNNRRTVILKSTSTHKHDGWRYGIYEFGNQNLVVFTSGIGDGRYANYIGYDANGKICRLLTDFAIFNW
ncbi:MAG: hypothetical protein B7Y15_12085 [Bacteroidetes bacterium 24-39-8]|jgi:hypothetical protein|nr:MAG: hypothetical protein B7Y69_02820 [Sphingobacteriia bacterium 35-40-8]OYZ48427.1 MAG: hypothetical protein B7Y15_12085 [Bacteroidetes bacterium 24-39-8]HQS54972.1 DUF4241 domain-containing protein [Sediminibacterium sp.]